MRSFVLSRLWTIRVVSIGVVDNLHRDHHAIPYNSIQANSIQSNSIQAKPSKQNVKDLLTCTVGDVCLVSMGSIVLATVVRRGRLVPCRISSATSNSKAQRPSRNRRYRSSYGSSLAWKIENIFVWIKKEGYASVLLKYF